MVLRGRRTCYISSGFLMPCGRADALASIHVGRSPRWGWTSAAHPGADRRVYAGVLGVAALGGHQNVRPAPASDQVARHILTILRIVPLMLHTQHILRRRRFVIHIAR